MCCVDRDGRKETSSTKYVREQCSDAGGDNGVIDPCASVQRLGKELRFGFAKLIVSPICTHRLSQGPQRPSLKSAHDAPGSGEGRILQPPRYPRLEIRRS